jgi:soluble lytic murein transglycosylase
LADDALWWRGRILENDNKLDEARSLYDLITSNYSSSSWAEDAAFRGGMLRYRAGKYREAIDIWSTRLAKATDPTERQRLTLWRGKALLKAGDKAGATIELQALARSGELDYFGVRANALLQNKNGQPKATRESKIDLDTQFDWPAAEAWLAQKTGRAVADTSWTQDKRWLRAQELWLVGRDTQASAEAFDLMDARQADPVVMYGMARALQAQGRVGLSARAGQRLLRVLQTNPNAGLPKALLSLSYPPAFAALVQKRAQDAGISPLLMLAFIRQESFFDPRAQAPDGGLGLTQVQPETGQSIAKKLNFADYEDDDLLMADNSLRFGASYMADQLKSFDNEVLVAFGAYNAGPEAAKRWRKATGGDDPDIYLESVEFAITRLYVQNVGENYAIYRYLYANEPVPDWP